MHVEWLIQLILIILCDWWACKKVQQSLQAKPTLPNSSWKTPASQ